MSKFLVVPFFFPISGFFSGLSPIALIGIFLMNFRKGESSTEEHVAGELGEIVIIYELDAEATAGQHDR